MPTRTPKANSGTSAATKAARPPVRRTPARRPSTRPHEELVLHGGTTEGTPFGRCGGRPILHRIERDVCDRLTRLGVAHSHRPRHFEVCFDDGPLAAYAPTMVLRGRGREGKTVIVETVESLDDTNLTKIRAFRRQYGPEFYVCFVAPEEVLDAVRLDTYDEASSFTDVHTLISRLAD